MNAAWPFIILLAAPYAGMALATRRDRRRVKALRAAQARAEASAPPSIASYRVRAKRRLALR